MTHQLDGCIARLNRAEEQLHGVKDRVNAFLAAGLPSVTIESDRHGRAVIRVLDVATPGDALSLAIGECIYSFRSALDHPRLPTGNSPHR